MALRRPIPLYPINLYSGPGATAEPLSDGGSNFTWSPASQREDVSTSDKLDITYSVCMDSPRQ